jgi:ABC-2 type transport system permease protein
MRKILALIKTNFADWFEYRGNLLIYSLSYAAQPVVYLLVWLAVSASSPTLPLKAGEFTQYYLWLLVVQLWVSAWASQIIAHDVRYGRLSRYLVMPLPYGAIHLSTNMSEKLLKTLLTMPLIAVLAVIFRPPWPVLSGWHWLLFLWTWFLAGAIYFLIDLCVGCLAFWFEETSAIDDLYNVLHSLFSGVLIPLFLMPPAIQALATFMPFRYSLSFPMEILLGRLSPRELSLGFILQLAFAVILYLAYRKLWQRGIKRYSAVGN